jgi:hypothetical protein
MLKSSIYEIGKSLGLEKEEIDSMILSKNEQKYSKDVDLYKAGNKYGTISPQSLYKAGTDYGTISPIELYKGGTYYGTISPNQLYKSGTRYGTISPKEVM